jgi:hypothetical protein
VPPNPNPNPNPHPDPDPNPNPNPNPNPSSDPDPDPNPNQACPASYVPPAYANPVEEGRRFVAFKATMLRLQGDKGGRQPTDAPVADQHADKTLDEMRTFAHFA